MSSAGNMDLASCTLVSEAMNFSAALRTSSVETPIGLISNKPGITFPFVVIPSKGAARPSCSFCSDIWRKRSANAKAGCHVPLNLNQLDDGYLILKDDEVFCGSDWIPLLKSETMVGDNERRPNMNSPLNSSWPRLAVFCLGALLAFSVACNRGPSQPGAATGQLAAKRYSLKGRVISVDKNAATANIDNEPIAGFMDAMIMPYTIKPPSTLDQLQPGDSITADVVVEPDRYWLENVKVTGHSKAPAGTPTATVRIPTPGDPVPDFKLINQNGKRISLHQYRGQTLLLTLIYTRCPFPD